MWHAKDHHKKHTCGSAPLMDSHAAIRISWSRRDRVGLVLLALLATLPVGLSHSSTLAGDIVILERGGFLQVVYFFEDAVQ